jgi:hypothetical protein
MEALLYIMLIFKNLKNKNYEAVSYVIWTLNILLLLAFNIIIKQNRLLRLTPAGYTILCVAGIMALYGGYCLYREYHIRENHTHTASIEAKNIQLSTKWENEYEKIVEYKEKLGYMRHDITKHISVLEQNISDEEKLQKLEDIKNYLNKVSETKYCDNKIVDAAIEKKITEISQKGINIESDIRLKGIRGSYENIVSVVIWLLIDNIAALLQKNDNIYIKINEKTIKNKLYISFYIETDRENIKLRQIDKSREMKMLKYMFSETDGSIMTLKKSWKTVETGMFLGSGKEI